MQRRNTDPPRSASGALRPLAAVAEPSLVGLVARARELDALDRTLRDALPEPLARHCRLANVRGSRLVFLASSSSVAARLRLAQATLLQAAGRVLGRPFDRLTLKVAPVPSVPPDQAPQKPLSNSASAHIADAARVLADPELRDLLLRMASLAK
jgi:hypothetical protein